MQQQNLKHISSNIDERQDKEFHDTKLTSEAQRRLYVPPTLT